MFNLKFYENSLLRKYTRNLTQLMPRKVLLAITLMVLLSFTEAVGLVLLIPLLGLVGLDVGQILGQIEK